MTRPCRFAVVVVALLVGCPVAAIAQQAIVIEKPAASTVSSQTEADKKLAEIMKGTGGVLDTRTILPQLEQFLRDNPTYPRLNTVYRYLLQFTSPTLTPDRALALADEATAKFPEDSQIRGAAISLRFRALQAQKKDDAIKVLGQKLLETETSPSVLQMAAAADRADSLKLLDKAIAERQKNTSETATPTLDDLRWAYAQSLTQAGRKDEGQKLSMEVLDQAKKSIADLEALPKDDPKRTRLTMLRMNIASRYQSLANLLSAAGDYQKALEYITLAEQNAGDDLVAVADRYEQVRAGIYARMGRPDLQLESYAKAFAVRMDVGTRDRIREVAARSNKKPEEVFERAREIRRQNATAISGFELKTLEGQTLTLDALRSNAKVTLVNFFFPT